MATERKQEGRMDMQAMMEVYKKVATPGPPHKKLGSLVGSWTTKTKVKNDDEQDAAPHTIWLLGPGNMAPY